MPREWKGQGRGDRRTLKRVTMEKYKKGAVSEPTREEEGSQEEGNEHQASAEKKKRCELKSGHWIRKLGIFRDVVKAEARL